MASSNTTLKFDITQTNTAKGLAILMLLWHHLFYNNPERYDWYQSLYYQNGVPIEALIASYSKLCVGIFLVLSGYGLYKSYDKAFNQSGCSGFVPTLKFDVITVAKRLLKQYSNYWIIYLLFVPVGFAFGRNVIEIYNGNPVNFIIDFFGLAYLFHDYINCTANGTWWFMSIIIICYIIFPLVYKLLNHLAPLTMAAIICAAWLMPDSREVIIWVQPFVFGALLCRYNVFDKAAQVTKNGFIRVAVGFVLLISSYVLRTVWLNHDVRLDFLFAFFVIIFTFFVLSKIPGLNKVLEELGKKSGLIFLFHTFIYSYYFKDFIYSFKYPVLIFGVLVTICYIIALIIQKVLDLTGYSKLIGRITSSKQKAPA